MSGPTHRTVEIPAGRQRVTAAFLPSHNDGTRLRLGSASHGAEPPVATASAP